MQNRINNLILVGTMIVALVLSSHEAAAQQDVAPEGYEYVDSLIYVRAAAADSSYVGVDVFDIDLNQSEAIETAMRRHITANPDRAISGYRVRIFFDNKQTARAESEKTLKKFESMYPEILAYRTYANPYFKVTVGDCRTKSEAMALLSKIKRSFPSAFVVKENISFPLVDKQNVYDVDTIQVLRPVGVPSFEL